MLEVDVWVGGAYLYFWVCRQMEDKVVVFVF